MRIDPIKLPDTNTLVADYKYNFSKVRDKFDFNPFDENTWRERVRDLQSQDYNRQGLVDVLTTMNDRWDASEPTFQNINKLKDSKTTAVVAGQQAGLLTGPLYTVHKVISVLQLAKQKESELEEPVVPIFWIAGEDHDFAEINHLHMKDQGRMKKIQVHTDVNEKSSVSDLPFNQEAVQNWLSKVFQETKETEYTSELYRRMLGVIQTSHSYTDFFAKVIYTLFPNEGLILLDAHDRTIRELESSYFLDLIHNNGKIADGVFSSVQENKQQRYPVSLDSEDNDAHLFFHKNGERILLARDQGGNFVGKKGEVTFSKEELLNVASEQPWLLSNNVVSRPLMQEYLLPVLAFIGGPGEISYWSALKPAFHAVGLTMPPVVPRLSFTMIDKKSEQLLEQFKISIEEAVQYGTVNHKLNWLASTENPPIGRLADQVKQEMEGIHDPLKKKAAELGPDMEALAQKNLKYIQQSIEFLEKRMVQSVEDKYTHELEDFDSLNLLIRPAGGLQERMWSVIPWLNLYGHDVFERMNTQNLSFYHSHYIVRI
ncbi:bacillithiol biosynthesis cysteine-adding enzyme BshC [Halobacillus seohaensis]|uniref:Putative cysteine ligase BshC n=1 Tax=Halobacillus seohaensis TaxID=447421 RepID=A0ABW2EK35_9BACI